MAAGRAAAHRSPNHPRGCRSATDIRTGAYGQADRVIVAGGGRFQCEWFRSSISWRFWRVTTVKPETAQPNTAERVPRQTNPATVHFRPPTDHRGSLGTGGTGVPNSYTSRTVGGGGGGGQYGGGGGFGSGAAGGGSSFADPTSTAAVKYGLQHFSRRPSDDFAIHEYPHKCPTRIGASRCLCGEAQR